MISLFSRLEALVTLVCISKEWMGMWYAMEMLDIFLIRLGSCRSNSFCSWFTIYFSLGRRSVSLLEFFNTTASVCN